MRIRKRTNVVIFTKYLYRWNLDLLHFIGFFTNAHLFTLGTYGNYPWKKLEKSIDTFGRMWVPAISDFLPNPKLFTKFLENKVHLLILYGAESLPAILLFYLSRLLRIFTIVVVEANQLEHPKSFFMRFLKSIKIKIIKNMYSKAHVIIVESHASQVYLKKILGVRRNDEIVRVHGINISLFKPLDLGEFAKRFGLGDDTRKIILFVGELSEYKGGDLLVESLQFLVQRGVKNFFVLIPSFGEIHRQYEDHISRLCKNRWLGIYNPLDDHDMPKLYSIADIVVAPSRLYTSKNSDRSPNSVIEALACGKVMIASYAGGIPTIVGNAGILIPPNNPEVLASKIQEVLAWDSSKYIDLQLKARAWAEKSLDMQKYARNLVGLYLEKSGVILEKNHRSD